MEQNNPALSKIKHKLLGQLIFSLVVVGIVAYVGYSFLFSGQLSMQAIGNISPVSRIIVVAVMLILLSHIARLLYDYVRMSKIVPIMQSLASSYGLKYSAEDSNEILGRHRPILGLISGSLQGKNVYAFQALEYVSRKNSPPKKLTIFQVKLAKSWPPFELQKKSFFGSLFGKLLGGVDYKGRFLLIPHSIEKKPKEEKVSEVLKVLSDDLLQDFESLSGKNTITVKENSLTVEHRGFIYSETDYGQFFTLLSKLK